MSKVMESYKDKLGGVLDEEEKAELANRHIPDSIANNQLFLSSLQLVVQFIRNKLKEKCVRFYDNPELRKEMELNTNLDQKFMMLASQKLHSLTEQLQISEVEDLRHLRRLAFFC